MRESAFMSEGNVPQYHSIVIVGKSAQRLWHWETWRQIVPILTPLVTACQTTVGVDSVQDFEGIDQRVCFGQLDWDAKGHLKWTHGSPLNQEKSRCWTFRYTEIWAPDLEICSREEIPPNLFISVENPFASSQPKSGQFNQFFHLAVEETLYHVYNDIARRVVQHVASLTESVLTLVQVTPWVSEADCVDQLTNRLRYDDIYDDLVPDISKMESNWALYDPGVPLMP